MKRNYYSLGVVFFIAVNLFVGNASSQALSIETNSQSELANSKSPIFSLRGCGMNFIQNKGQIVDMQDHLRPDILFTGDDGGTKIYLRKTGISYVLTNMTEVMHELKEQEEELEKASKANEQERKQELEKKQIINGHRIDVDFISCNPNIEINTTDQVEGYTNYYYAHCPTGITRVNSFNLVTVKNIYNNIDVKYYACPEQSRRGGKEKGLKYDIVIYPGGNPNDLKLKYSGAEGIEIENGELKIKNSVSEIREQLPKVYQNINGKIVDVKTEYRLDHLSNKDVIVHFSFSTFNSSFPLIVDPWITYYGGSGAEISNSIATDKIGNVVLTGQSLSSNFPVSAGAFQLALQGASDAFVVKMDANGNRLWATYYGGSLSETGWGIATDALNNIIFSGETLSNNFPIGAIPGNSIFQNTAGGGAFDVFVAKLDITGQRIWASYYGGTSFDYRATLAIDAGNNIIVCGNTTSPSGIASGGAVFQPVFGGGTVDVFIAKFDPLGNRQWATYYGGSDTDAGRSITCDASNNIYFTGFTDNNSNSFPIGKTGANIMHQTIYGGGQYDAFLVKFDQSGNRLWSTFYGGTGPDYGYDVCVDGLSNPVIVGQTCSTTNISSPGAYQPFSAGTCQDGFLVKFDPIGNRQWGTYLSGNMGAIIYHVAADNDNNIYAYGDFEDAGPGNYSASSCAYQPNWGGGPSSGNEDQFIGKYDPIGKQICFTYIGGSGEDDLEGGGEITINGNSLYITGTTTGGYPVSSNAYQKNYGGGSKDIFIDQLCVNLCEAKTLSLNYTASNTTTCANSLVTFTPTVNNSCDTSGYKFQWTFTGGNPSSSTAIKPSIIYTTPGSYPVKLVLTTICKKDSITKPSYITVNNCGPTVTTTGNSVCPGVCANVTSNPNGGSPPYAYLWNNGSTSQNINPCPATTTTYTVKVTDSGGNTATSTAVVTVNPSVSVFATAIDIICNGDNGSASALGGNGTSPYTYSWSNGQTTQTTTGLKPGNYTVTATDSKGCTASATTDITSVPPLAGQFTKGTANCIGCGCKEWIMVNATGGTSPYTYTWPGGYTNRYKNQLCPGTYSINIKDKNGCSINVILTVP